MTLAIESNSAKAPKSIMFKLKLTAIVLIVNVVLFFSGVIGLSIFFGIKPHALYAGFHAFCMHESMRFHLPLPAIEMVFGVAGWLAILVAGALFMLL